MRLLSAQGWNILNRNYRRSGFELDIIAQKGQTLAIIEVKTRRHLITGQNSFSELLPQSKRDALIKGARHFVADHNPLYQTIRFDLAVVTLGKGNTQTSIQYFTGILD